MYVKRFDTNIIKNKQIEEFNRYILKLDIPSTDKEHLLNIIKNVTGIANLYYNYSMQLEHEVFKSVGRGHKYHDALKRAWEKTKI